MSTADVLAAPAPTETPAPKKVLHVGCGFPNPNKLFSWFRGPEWKEIRFDINPDVQPDIIGTMTDMSAVESGSMDAVWSSHNIEHLYHHEVPVALAEFLRVLKPGGRIVVTCPDLQSVAKLVAEGNLEGVAYTAPAGPIMPLDILYGYGRSIANGNVYMAHRTGFTQQTLATAAQRAGFNRIQCKRGDNFDLWLVAHKPD